MEYSTVSTSEENESNFYGGLAESERNNLVAFLNEAYGEANSLVSESSEEKMLLAKKYIEETKKVISITINKVAH